MQHSLTLRGVAIHDCMLLTLVCSSDTHLRCMRSGQGITFQACLCRAYFPAFAMGFGTSSQRSHDARHHGVRREAQVPARFPSSSL